MTKFFYLHFNEEDDGRVAISADASLSEIEKLDVNEGAPIRFSLINGSAQDYQANDLGWPLMSQKMKNIFERHDSGADIGWHKALVLLHDGSEREFYIPHFLRRFDVLNESRSKVVNGPIGNMIIKACLAGEKVAELAFFPVPGSEIRLIISERLMNEIEKENLKGVDFSSVPVS